MLGHKFFASHTTESMGGGGGPTIISGALWNAGATLYRIPSGTLTIDSSSSPRVIESGNQFVYVDKPFYSTGGSTPRSNSVYAIKADGTLWSGLGNGTNRLGLGISDPGDIRNLNKVGTGSIWKKVVNSENCAIGLMTDGTMWGWGNGTGKLGTATSSLFGRGLVESSSGYNAPLKLNTDSWIDVTTAGAATYLNNGFYTIAIKSDGTMWSTGDNSNLPPASAGVTRGFLGRSHTTATGSLRFFQIGTGSTWVSCSAGMGVVSAIQNNGTLWTWGFNGAGELGLGDTSVRNEPTQVGTDTDWVEVSCGVQAVVARKTTGTIWFWGSGLNGQNGLGDTSSRTTPHQIGTDTDWVYVSNGLRQSAAVKSNGTLYTWGRNDQGGLAQGDTTERNTPTQVGSATNWQKNVGLGTLTIFLRTE